jgi:preprotein translocase subunit SecB
MSDAENGAPPGAAPESGLGQEPVAPAIAIRAQYVKDFSYENPHAPLSLSTTKGQPDVEVNVDVQAKTLNDVDYEVLLRIEATGKHTDATAFVLELLYGGVFSLQGIAEENRQAVCLIECPRIIFPFARRIIADATRDAGYPPLLLDPIDFAALYRQHMAAQATIGTGEDSRGNGGAPDG